jgi:hypothetical protein
MAATAHTAEAEEEPMSHCTDGRGERHEVAPDVWLISPEGHRIGTMCQMHADEVIAEYRNKLGEVWSTEPYERVA